MDMFGFPCELDEIRAICERRGLVLIEDAAEALGAEYKGRPVGSQGVSGVFGFYPNKQLATGEGGIVFTHSEEEWQVVKSLRNQGRDYRGGAWFFPSALQLHRWTGSLQAAIRDRPAEAQPRSRSGGGGSATRCSRTSRSSRSAPTTPSTSARGSSTSSFTAGAGK